MTSIQQATQNPLRQVLNFGQSIWYDGLISKKEFERMIREDGIRGATTNPTIFEKAIAGGEYDRELERLLKTQTDEEIYKTFAVEAVQEVADTFLPVFKETKGEDGFVSIEVSPLLAYETQATIREAKELYRLVNRKNIMIKIPATRQGIPAISAVIAEGINVNVTLIFSIRRYQEVMDAYLAGLEKRTMEGKPVSGIASVASFFVSRVDTATDKILGERIQSEKNPATALELKSLVGKVAIANSKAAYLDFEKVFSGARFEKLKLKGAKIQRPLWASTGTKNPNYSDVLYVEALMGPRTVDTIPPATMDAFRDHGVARPRLKEKIDEAAAIISKLKELNIDLDQITQELEVAGVKSFSDSYGKIVEVIKAKRH